MTVRVGIIGSGAVALDHGRAILACGAEIAGASATTIESPRWKQFSASFPDVPFVPTDDLLTDDGIDALVACLPWSVMDHWLPALLTVPRPMLVEKPLGTSAKAITHAWAKAGPESRNKRVAYNRRFYGPVRSLQERVGRGGLQRARITISENLDSLLKRWGTAILPNVYSYSSTSHILDVALHLFGHLECRAVVRRPVRGYEPFVDLSALLVDREDVPIALTVGAFEPVAIGIACLFDDRTLWDLSPMERLTVYDGYDVLEPTAESPIRRYRPRITREEYVAIEQRPGFIEQMRSFLAMVEKGKNSDTAATVESTLELHRLIEQLAGQMS